ncbi:MATE family efflux transporter [Sphingomonas ginkgonis]|uniref:MATE family efflux transporter n=1 Tax=Sphingomonas ginkgonis TaxID=2315330 RepID=A0A3R9X720_9SPHN|nr:MATE family efflux transporter [Sphingomonas ginkgonis]RST30365.1 MATE family efflux transporter [Sphingomonas ginkgonis]
MATRAMSQGRGRHDLTQGPITRTLLLFMLPTLGSSILQSLNASINTIWVGRMLGEQALAATSNANTVMFLLLAFVFGFGMAATILIGQSFGRRDVEAARRVIGTAVAAFFAVAVAMSAIGYVLAPRILGWLATPAPAVPLALAYLRVIFLGMPAALTLAMLMMAIRGSGDSLTPLWFMGLSVVLDSGLNPVFIAGLGPAPKLGIAGAATATLIANWVALAALIGWTYLRDLPLRLRGAELRFLLPDPALLRTIITKGLPMGLQMIAVSASAMTMFGLVNRQGVDTTAAFGVALQLWTYVQMPAMAVGAAVSTMVAQNIGAGQWDRVGKVTNSGIGITLAVTGVMVVLLALADRTVLALFLGGNSPALPIARHIQLLGTWGYLLFGVTMVIFGTVRANGAVIPPLIILAVGLLPIRIGFATLAQRWIGPDALWLSLPIASAANLVLALAYYRSGRWRKAHIDVPPEPEECVEQSVSTMDPGGRLHPTG